MIPEQNGCLEIDMLKLWSFGNLLCGMYNGFAHTHTLLNLNKTKDLKCLLWRISMHLYLNTSYATLQYKLKINLCDSYLLVELKWKTQQKNFIVSNHPTDQHFKNLSPWRTIWNLDVAVHSELMFWKDIMIRIIVQINVTCFHWYEDHLLWKVMTDPISRDFIF